MQPVSSDRVDARACLRLAARVRVAGQIGMVSPRFPVHDIIRETKTKDLTPCTPPLNTSSCCVVVVLYQVSRSA